MDSSPHKEARTEFLLSYEKINVEHLVSTLGWFEPTVPDLLFLAQIDVERYMFGVYEDSNLPQAIIALRMALRSDPGNYRVIFELSDVLRREGELDEARSYALAARALRPDHPRPHMLLGEILEAKGDLDGALEAHTRAVTLAPSQRSAYRGLTRLLRDEAHGAFSEARLRDTISSVASLRLYTVPARRLSRRCHTALSANRIQVQALKALVGTSQVVLRSDFPFMQTLDTIQALQECCFSEQEQRGVARDNAVRSLPAWKCR